MNIKSEILDLEKFNNALNNSEIEVIKNIYINNKIIRKLLNEIKIFNYDINIKQMILNPNFDETNLKIFQHYIFEKIGGFNTLDSNLKKLGFNKEVKYLLLILSMIAGLESIMLEALTITSTITDIEFLVKESLKFIENDPLIINKTKKLIERIYEDPDSYSYKKNPFNILFRNTIGIITHLNLPYRSDFNKEKHVDYFILLFNFLSKIYDIEKYFKEKPSKQNIKKIKDAEIWLNGLKILYTMSISDSLFSADKILQSKHIFSDEFSKMLLKWLNTIVIPKKEKEKILTYFMLEDLITELEKE